MSSIILGVWRFLSRENHALSAIAALIFIVSAVIATILAIAHWTTSSPPPFDEVNYRLPTMEYVDNLISTLQSLVPLQGTVVDTSGHPVAGAVVATDFSGFISPGVFNRPHYDSPRGSTTNETGAFEIGIHLSTANLVVWHRESKPMMLRFGDVEVPGQSRFGEADGYPGWYSTGFPVKDLILDDFRFVATPDVSPLFIELTLTVVDDSGEYDSVHEFHIRNPTSRAIRLANTGLLFERFDPSRTCCCPTGEPVNYRVDVRSVQDTDGTTLHFPPGQVSVLGDDLEPLSPLKYQARGVSRQWCQTGDIALQFPSVVEIPATSSHILRILFPAGSDLARYDYHASPQNAITANSTRVIDLGTDSAEENRSWTTRGFEFVSGGYRRFIAIFVDDKGRRISDSSDNG